MSFLNPTALWAFAALAPLAALYLLRVRPERVTTNTIFLWDQTVRQSRASTLFKRLRDLLSLLLMALTVSLLAMAAANPVWEDGGNRHDILLIIDRGASMAAKTADGKTRLDQAKKRARRLIRNLTPGRGVILAAWDNELKILTGATGDPAALLEALDKITLKPMPSSVTPLLELADSNAVGNSDEKKQQPTAIVITDGLAAGIGKLEGGISLITIADPNGGNIGIIDFTIKAEPNRLRLRPVIFSSFPDEREIDLTVSTGDPDKTVKVVPLAVKQGINNAETITIDTKPYGKWVVGVDIDDDLAIDNRAFAFIPKPKPIRVGVGETENQFYRLCVEAFSAAETPLIYDRINPGVTVSDGDGGAKDGARIIFTPTGESPFWRELGGELPPVVPELAIKNHPVTTHYDLSLTPFSGAKQITAPPGAVILAETNDGVPLIYRIDNAYVVNMSPEKSDWFLSPYFPVMIYAMAADLTNSSPPPPSVNRLGDALDEEKIETPGFSRNASGDTVAASLLNQWESGRTETAVSAATEPAVIAATTKLAPILLLLALAFATVEFILYHSRKVG